MHQEDSQQSRSEKHKTDPSAENIFLPAGPFYEGGIGFQNIR